MRLRPVFLGGAAFGIQDHLLDIAGDPAAMAYNPHTDIPRDQLVHVAAEIGAEQAHQGAHFRLGPFPILARESEQGEIAQLHVAGGANRLAHRVHAREMPGLARQMPLARPTPIAIHDNGDMAG